MVDPKNPPISHLFAAIACWARQQGMPPKTLWEGQTDEWLVTINGTSEMQDGLSPRTIHLKHKVYMALAILDASGGAVVGPPETELIAHFEALLKEPLEIV